MKTKMVLVFIVVAGLFVPQSLLFGQGRGFRGGWGGILGGPMAAAYLGLSQDQMSQIKTLRQTEWTTVKPYMQQMRTYQQQLRGMIQSTAALNAAQVTALASNIATLQAKITVAQAQMQWQVYNQVLNGTQQAALNQLQQNVQQMRQNHESAQSSSSSSGSNP
jgi:hypothetical protein